MKYQQRSNPSCWGATLAEPEATRVWFLERWWEPWVLWKTQCHNATATAMYCCVMWCIVFVMYSYVLLLHCLLYTIRRSEDCFRTLLDHFLRSVRYTNWWSIYNRDCTSKKNQRIRKRSQLLFNLPIPQKTTCSKLHNYRCTASLFRFHRIFKKNIPKKSRRPSDNLT